MLAGIRHTGLVVQDLEAARRFWCDVMGFTVGIEMHESGPYVDGMLGLSGARVTTVKLSAPDGQLLELLRFDTHPSTPSWQGTPISTGYTHLALTVADMGLSRERLAQHGAEFLGDPQTSPDGKVAVAYCRGPEGVLIELVQELGHAPAQQTEGTGE